MHRSVIAIAIALAALLAACTQPSGGAGGSQPASAAPSVAPASAAPPPSAAPYNPEY